MSIMSLTPISAALSMSPKAAARSELASDRESYKLAWVRPPGF
jgi:hypothetical protein